jgi:hypothetical protein
VVDAIVGSAATGKIGDGKVWVVHNTAGSGRSVWETRHREPLVPFFWPAVRAFKPPRTMVGCL